MPDRMPPSGAKESVLRSNARYHQALWQNGCALDDNRRRQSSKLRKTSGWITAMPATISGSYLAITRNSIRRFRSSGAAKKNSREEKLIGSIDASTMKTAASRSSPVCLGGTSTALGAGNLNINRPTKPSSGTLFQTARRNQVNGAAKIPAANLYD